MKVIKALTRKMDLEEGLIDKLPGLMEDHILSRHPGAALTGADMYGWASAAYLAGLKRTVTELIADGYVAGSLPEGEAPPVVVKVPDFIEAGLGVRPSVSEAEIRDYEGMREKYSNTGGSKKKDDAPPAASPAGFDPMKAAQAYKSGAQSQGLPGAPGAGGPRSPGGPRPPPPGGGSPGSPANNPSFPPPQRQTKRRMGSGMGGGSGIPGLGS